MTLTVLLTPCTGSLLPGTTVRATPGAAYFTHSEHKEVKLKLSGWDGRNSGKIIPGFSFLVLFQPFLCLHGHMSILAATGNFLESLQNGWGVSGSPKDIAWAKVHLNTMTASRLARNCLFVFIPPILPQKEYRSWKTFALPAKRCRTPIQDENRLACSFLCTYTISPVSGLR